MLKLRQWLDGSKIVATDDGCGLAVYVCDAQVGDFSPFSIGTYRTCDVGSSSDLRWFRSVMLPYHPMVIMHGRVAWFRIKFHACLTTFRCGSYL